MISGFNDDVEFFGIPLGCDTGKVLDQITTSIDQSEQAGVDVLVFTDLFFGTPFNLLMTIVNSHKFSHITGVNLPILLEAITLQDQKDLLFHEVLDDLVSKGRASVVNCDILVQELLRKKES